MRVIVAAWALFSVGGCDGPSAMAPPAPEPTPPPSSSPGHPDPDPADVYTPPPPELGPVTTGEEWRAEHPDAPALLAGTYTYLESRGISREYQEAHLRVRGLGGLTHVLGGRTLVMDWVVSGRRMRVELPGLVLTRGTVTQVPVPGAPEGAAYLAFADGGALRPFRAVTSVVGAEMVDRGIRGCDPAIFTGRLIVSPWLDDDGRWTVEFRDGVVGSTVMVAKLDLESGELLLCERIKIVHQ